MAERLVFGVHPVRHSLEAQRPELSHVYLQKRKRQPEKLRELLDKAQKRGLPVTQVEREELDRRCSTTHHQGVMAMLTGPVSRHGSLKDLIAAPQSPLLLLVLDGIQDPRNFGACLRSADAAGVDAVILGRDKSAPLNATVSKVASGAAEHTPVFRVINIARTLRELQKAGVWVVGTVAGQEQGIHDVDMTVSTAIVMGAEGRGLRENTRKHCDHLVSLPMKGVVESLNVSVATGICLYEVLRQRRTGDGR